MNNKNQNLPPGWVWVKLGEVCELYQPKTISIKELKSNGEYFVYGANGIIGKYDKYNHEEEELIITCRGASCGNTHITKPKSWINGNAMIVKPFNKLLLRIKFLSYALKSDNRIVKTITGTAQPQITQTSLSSLTIPLPPLSEQHRIVAKIEELFSSLDKAVERLKATREQLKIYRQAVLKWAFEGRFTHKDIKQGELPEGWVWVKLGEVCNEIKPGFPFGRHNKEKIGIPQLRPMNINIKGMIDLSDVKYIQPEKEYDKLIKGDVLFNNTNSPALLGKTSYIRKNTNWTYSNHMTRIRLNESLANPAWVSYYLHSLFLSGFFRLNCTNHVNQASINTKFLENKVIIPLPPLSEQQQIVSEIEKRLSVAEKVEESIRVALEKAERLRQSILKKAFEGKLVPQDPNDEPASVLLEKIKAEKKQHRKQK